MPQDLRIEFTQICRLVLRKRFTRYEGSNLINETVVGFLVPLGIRQLQC
jgi:hypothetical protein